MTEHQGDAGPEPAPEWIRQGPQTIEAPPAATAPKRRRGTRLWTALILIVLVVAAVASAPYWTSLLPWAAPGEPNQTTAALERIDQRLGDLTERETALEQRLSGIEHQLASQASSDAAQEQAAALRQLADRLSALEQRAPPSPDTAPLADLTDTTSKLNAGLAELGARLDKLEAHNAETSGSPGDAALLLALGQLRGALDSGRPYAGELATVKILAQSRPELAPPLAALAGNATSGVASLPALTQRFTQEVAPALLRAPAPPESEGIADRVMARLRSLVVIHRIGDKADPVESAVERAEAALERNDLASAIAALEPLPPRDAALAEDWLAAARQRVAASQALDRLDAGIGDKLTAPAAAAQ